jgi:acyl-CoA:6-aminopenicillanic acid acyl transferase
MDTHANFVSMQADTNYELGLQLGRHFRAEVQAALSVSVRDAAWALTRARAHAYLAATEAEFPQYVAEMRGYATGAGVDFLDLWARSLEDEFSAYRSDPGEYGGERCTSIITNDGHLIAHNEDWAKDAADQIGVLQKTVGGLTVFELHYVMTLGGNSASINSHGFVQLINTLTHTDWQMGAPRNVIARFMSETGDPASDFARLRAIKRATGYNHTLIGRDGAIWNIEATATQQVLRQPRAPFAHANHYLAPPLRAYEAAGSASSRRRYEVACARVQPRMSVRDLMDLTNDTTHGPDLSICNERTIARMVVDLERHVAHCWLAREAKKGWIAYQLTFL